MNLHRNTKLCHITNDGLNVPYLFIENLCLSNWNTLSTYHGNISWCLYLLNYYYFKRIQRIQTHAKYTMLHRTLDNTRISNKIKNKK
jgi:hypothetical protein